MQPLVPYFQSLQFSLPLPSFLPADQATLHGFGIAAALGLILGLWISVWRASRRGLDVLALYAAFAWLVFGAVIGGHLAYLLLYAPRAHLVDPGRLFDFSSGLASIGVIAGSSIALALMFHRRRLPPWPYLDSLVIGLSFAWFMIRVGCTLNHEHPGGPTRFFLGRYCRPVTGHTVEWPATMTPAVADLRFGPCVTADEAPVTRYADQVAPDYPGIVAMHDLGWYEALFALGLFLLLLWLERRPHRPGFHVMLAVVLYAVARFLLDFLQPVTGTAHMLRLTLAQWAMMALVLLVIWRRRRQG